MGVALLSARALVTTPTALSPASPLSPCAVSQSTVLTVLTRTAAPSVGLRSFVALDDHVNVWQVEINATADAPILVGFDRVFVKHGLLPAETVRVSLETAGFRPI